MALSQESICTKRVHLGLSEVAFWGVLTSGVVFMMGSTVSLNTNEALKLSSQMIKLYSMISFYSWIHDNDDP